jgi:DNA repair protein RecO (recombination protein O)
MRLAASGETSRVVTWLTPDHGRLATLLKGALRPNNAFLGQYDLFYTCELLYYPRPHGDLHFAKECCPIKLRTRFRSDWVACAQASYLTDLAMRAIPAHAPQRQLFLWLNHGLDELARADFTPSLTIWLELKLLDILGLAPRLSTCMTCHTPLETGRITAHFSNERGGLLCPRCAHNDTRAAPPLAADVLAILRNWQRAGTSSSVRRTRLDPQQSAPLEQLLGQFLRFHLDMPIPARDIAFAVARRG